MQLQGKLMKYVEGFLNVSMVYVQISQTVETSLHAGVLGEAGCYTRTLIFMPNTKRPKDKKRAV